MENKTEKFIKDQMVEKRKYYTILHSVGTLRSVEKCTTPRPHSVGAHRSVEKRMYHAARIPLGMHRSVKNKQTTLTLHSVGMQP